MQTAAHKAIEAIETSLQTIAEEFGRDVYYYGNVGIGDNNVWVFGDESMTVTARVFHPVVAGFVSKKDYNSRDGGFDACKDTRTPQTVLREALTLMATKYGIGQIPA